VPKDTNFAEQILARLPKDQYTLEEIESMIKTKKAILDDMVEGGISKEGCAHIVASEIGVRSEWPFFTRQEWLNDKKYLNPQKNKPETYTDDNGYERFSNLVHRQVAYKEIYLKNRKKYPLPFGKYQIHHIDGYKQNNNVSNLQILTREEHRAVHGLDDDTSHTKTHLVIRQIIKHKFMIHPVIYSLIGLNLSAIFFLSLFAPIFGDFLGSIIIYTASSVFTWVFGYKVWGGY